MPPQNLRKDPGRKVPIRAFGKKKKIVWVLPEKVLAWSEVEKHRNQVNSRAIDEAQAILDKKALPSYKDWPSQAFASPADPANDEDAEEEESSRKETEMDEEEQEDAEEEEGKEKLEAGNSDDGADADKDEEEKENDRNGNQTPESKGDGNNDDNEEEEEEPEPTRKRLTRSSKANVRESARTRTMKSRRSQVAAKPTRRQKRRESASSSKENQPRKKRTSAIAAPADSKRHANRSRSTKRVRYADEDTDSKHERTPDYGLEPGEGAGTKKSTGKGEEPARKRRKRIVGLACRYLQRLAAREDGGDIGTPGAPDMSIGFSLLPL